MLGTVDFRFKALAARFANNTSLQVKDASSAMFKLIITVSRDRSLKSILIKTVGWVGSFALLGFEVTCKKISFASFRLLTLQSIPDFRN